MANQQEHNDRRPTVPRMRFSRRAVRPAPNVDVDRSAGERPPTIDTRGPRGVVRRQRGHRVRGPDKSGEAFRFGGAHRYADAMADGTPGGAGVAKPKSAEMFAGPGFRVRHQIERPDAEVLAGFGAFDTPDISDLMNRLYTMSSDIHCVTTDGGRILGPACTVKVFPGDNLMVHKSLDIARPGDVVVVDASASTSFAVLGDLVSAKARHRGIAGFVVDGLVRDLPDIQALGDLPVFARGVSPIGPLHRGPGEVNFPVSAGGIVVHPGDIVVGDRNGVVVVPREYGPVLLDRLRAQADAQRDYVKAVAAGEFSNAWVDVILEEGGVQIEVEGPAARR
jgi:regulator of RNase E activity RraA